MHIDFVKPCILQRLDLHMYVDVILFVMCKENPTICNVYINLTQPMFGSCFTSCLLEGACLIYVNCVCVCVHSGVQHTLCCVFASFYCHFWIALWYSLTFSVNRRRTDNTLARRRTVKGQKDKQLSSRIYEDKFLHSPLKLVVNVLKWNNIRLVCQTTLARL
jgi:hypothetical protein